MSAYEDYMKAAQLYMDGKTDMNAVEKSKQKLYDNFIEVYKAAGNSFENPTDKRENHCWRNSGSGRTVGNKKRRCLKFKHLLFHKISRWQICMLWK